jgi:chitinase
MQFFSKVSAVILLLAIIIVSCKKEKTDPPPPPSPIVIAPPPDFGFKVVGYFPSYRNPASVPDVKFKMINVVNYAFFTVDASGGLVLNSPATFTTVVAKAKTNNAKIFMSINGSAADFKNMAATSTGRNSFIKLIMGNMRQYALDGVDIDWEFPSTADGTDITFTALMKELSDSCHRDAKYYLTAAVTAGKYAGGIRDAIKTELFTYVDWLNIMVYDDFSTTLSYRHHSDMTLTQLCLNYWVNTRGLPKNKCVLGLPAYGRPSGITQTNTILTYAGILAQGGSPQSDSAMVTSSGYSSPYMVYYNGVTTIKKKTMLAKELANGVMMWEKGQDTHDASSLLKAACDTIGRTY